MEILKRKKVYRIIRDENGEEVKSVVEEIISSDVDGLESEQSIYVQQCSCGRELNPSDKIYTCRSCSRKGCSECMFQCQSGCITCLRCGAILDKKIYCESCYELISGLYREKNR